MTSRAGILPHPIDPFMLAYWLHGFHNVWGKEIDKLYIVANSPIREEVVDYIKKITSDPKIVLLYFPKQIEHGDAINRALEMVQEKHVVLLEDDCMIFKQGVVDKCFKELENGNVDIVASKRGSCHPEIMERAKNLWGLSYEGFGDQGCNFFPNLYFSSVDLLKKTDRDFGARAWKKGEIIKELDNYTVVNDVIYGDTFVWASLQLRSMVHPERICIIPQYHGSPDDPEDYEHNRALWDGHAPWCHIGSLSSGIHGILTDERGVPLAYSHDPQHDKNIRDIGKIVNTEGERREFERRLQWWLTFVDFGDQKQLAEFRQEYRNAIARALMKMHISMKNIAKRQRIYKELGLW